MFMALRIKLRMKVSANKLLQRMYLLNVLIY